MATIKPFRAIHPNPFYADQLIFVKPQAELVTGHLAEREGAPPLKTLLETGARQRPETPEGQALAYRDINDTFMKLLKNERLWWDANACLYVYEVMHPTYSQVGIWALTDLADPVKTHELTFDDSVRRIKNYREYTGLEGSPILLTYHSNQLIDSLIAINKQGFPDVHYESTDGIHKLWRIDHPERLKQLMAAFAGIETVYLADGHHRKQSAELLLRQQLKNKQTRFGAISALYMSLSELKIREYHRVIIPDRAVSGEQLLSKLQAHFDIQKSFKNKAIEPLEERIIGLYIQGTWYHLKARSDTYTPDCGFPALDVSILQNYILSPLFQVSDPANDLRLKHVGGEGAMNEMESLFRKNACAIGFTLCPMTASQLCNAADAGINLPPKSTWIDPKIPYGLLLYKHH